MSTRPFIRRGSLVLLGALALVAPAAAPAQDHFYPSEDIEVMLRYLVEDGETPGIVLGLLRVDGSTEILHYGDAGPDTRPLGPKSRFEIGSITKTFTATLLADMVVRGEMALDDPVQKYLPEAVNMPNWEDRQITLADLSTHHSGLPRMPDNFDPADPANPYADYTTELLYEFLNTHELRRAPGSEFEYSNLAVGLLGHVLELHTGMPYEELVRERILEPLGMDMTGIELRGPLADWMTKGHNSVGDVVPYWDVMTLAGAGGLRSNGEDVLKYLAAQIDPPDSPLGDAIRLTQEPQVDRDEDSQGGLGWGIYNQGMRRILTHGGGTAGFSTRVAFDPDLGVAMVRLSNSGEFEDDIGMDMLRRGSPIEKGVARVPPEILTRYVGEYELGGNSMFVRLEDGGFLTMQAPPNVRFRMYASSDSSFFLKRTPWQFTFLTNDDGEVSGVQVDLEGNRGEGRKVSAETPSPVVAAGNDVPEVKDVALTNSQISAYAGTYVLDFGEGSMEIRIWGEGRHMMAQRQGQRQVRLMYQGDHEFRLKVDPMIRLVFNVEEGEPITVTLHQGGQSVTGGRKDAGGA